MIRAEIWESYGTGRGSGDEIIALSLSRVQANLNAAIWTQDDTREILCERSRISTLNPAEMLHQADGKIVYFRQSKLLCALSVFS